MDIVRRIQTFNAGREPERLRMKYRAMRGSTFAFLRGTCHLFYDRLPRGGIFKSAPLAWACGDLHLENFGSYKGDNRLVYFDMNDFDEAALAPASWELVRMLTSVLVGAGSLSIRAPEARRLCAGFIETYAASLSLGKAYWVERDTAQGLVKSLLDSLRDRHRADFLAARTRLKGGGRLLLIDGKKALAATAEQRQRVTDFMRVFARAQPNPEFFEVLDVARRVAGTGSLGIERYVILVRGKGSPDANYLLDLKQSLPSSLMPHLNVAQPEWQSEAHRVVGVQRRMQAVSAAFLRPVRMGETAFVLRGLQPSQDAIELDRSTQSRSELQQAMATMAGIVAWAQLRSSGREGSASADELIDFGRREKWKAKLMAAAEACAEQVRIDAAAFDKAFDEGAFEADRKQPVKG